MRGRDDGFRRDPHGDRGVSYDDGATWHRAALRPSADGWTARLDAPGRARYASLRTTAKDTEGNGISQTLIRAFGLR